MENYKSELVTVELFLQNRPDMEIHSPKTITTAILTAATLLNSECNNLINDVWEFNRLQPTNPDNDLFRSNYELSQIKEAIISQTQYNLNMGNDFAIGGGSYSIGNVNTSYNRPENRPALAPGVLKLLQNARVYVLTDFGKFFNKSGGKECVNPALAQKDWADAKFLEKHHPNAIQGNVAYIDNHNNVNFGNPQDLDITTYKTKLIAGGRGNHQDFYKIDEVPNIAFFGNDDYGTYSAVQRGELKAMGINPVDLKKVWDPINGVYKFINDFDISYWNGITKDQAYFAIYASGTVWRPDGIYRLGWITQKVNALNELRWYESLIDNNVGLDPVTNPQAWKELANQAVDLNQIIDQLKPYIDQVIDGRIDNALDQRKHQFVQETQGQILAFKDQADYEAFRDANNLVDNDFENTWPEKLEFGRPGDPIPNGMIGMTQTGKREIIISNNTGGVIVPITIFGSPITLATGSQGIILDTPKILLRNGNSQRGGDIDINGGKIKNIEYDYDPKSALTKEAIQHFFREDTTHGITTDPNNPTEINLPNGISAILTWNVIPYGGNNPDDVQVMVQTVKIVNQNTVKVFWRGQGAEVHFQLFYLE